MKNFGDFLKTAQSLQSRMAEMQEKLDALEVEGVSGGGLVRVTLTGRGALKSARIDPSLLKPEEAGIVEDLIVAAHHDAKTKLEAAMREEMGGMTGGLPLPPGFKLPF